MPKEKKIIINSSSFIPVERSKIYEWNIPYCPISGNEKSVFAIIIFHDNKKREVTRRTKNFRNFSGNEQTLTMRSEVSLGAKFAMLGFRINCAGAEPCYTKIMLPEINQCFLETTENTEESYDDIFDYVKLFDEVDLEKEPYKAVGGRSFFTGSELFFPDRLDLLKYMGLVPNSTILDIGCGTGSLINSLKSFLISPKNYVGTDLVMKGVEYCRQRYPEFEFHKNEQTKLPNLNRKFDMVCLFSVFTHMYPNQIRDMLKEIKKVLNNGGCIVATVNINEFISSSYIGTIQCSEMTEKTFLDSGKSAGFSKISRYSKREKGLQTIYKIQE